MRWLYSCSLLAKRWLMLRYKDWPRWVISGRWDCLWSDDKLRSLYNRYKVTFVYGLADVAQHACFYRAGAFRGCTHFSEGVPGVLLFFFHGSCPWAAWTPSHSLRVASSGRDCRRCWKIGWLLSIKIQCGIVDSRFTVLVSVRARINHCGNKFITFILDEWDYFTYNSEVVVGIMSK